ncbi:MAG: Rne/Rng family ribonuclease [Longimonas sp.]|uniref:Rne/Rng family ribonuclease n=1 Tax=Longimonas sp. TaxID=2039626 RepID=UPI00397603DD
MSKEIIVNVADTRTRIAIVEEGKLAELYIENAEHKRTIGNLYLGIVRRVMPSIRAAFVDIGQEQDAFLHFSDLSENLPQLKDFLSQNTPKVESVSLPNNLHDQSPNPTDHLRRNQRLLVQVKKEPIANKGSRISTDLSMAGRFIVLVPLSKVVAVSRKIEKDKERNRLKALAGSLVPDGFGVIVRTVAEGRDAKSLDKDLRLLLERWRRVENRLAQATNAPTLIHEDVDMASSIIRDQFSDEFDRILIDNKALFHSVRSYVRAVAPSMVSRVEYHSKSTPIFEAADIQQGADRAFKDRVELPSGGYLFIERTEAMHVVDVNSGRSGRGKSQSQNSLDVNLEAARVIARQVRLRDLGGIIVVDFIDLRDEKARKKVYDELKALFEEDRAITKVLPMSDFGLVQITRQRLRPSLTSSFASSSGVTVDSDDESDTYRQRLREAQSRLARLENRLQSAQEKVKERESEIEQLKRQADRAADDASTDTSDDAHERPASEEISALNDELEQVKQALQVERSKHGQTRSARDKAKTEARKAKKQLEAAERERDAQAKAAEQAKAKAAEAAQSAEAVAHGAESTRPADEVIDALDTWVAEHAAQHRAVTLRVHPFLAAYLTRAVPSYPTQWFMRHFVRVHLETDETVSPLSFAIDAPDTGATLVEA